MLDSKVQALKLQLATGSDFASLMNEFLDLTEGSRLIERSSTCSLPVLEATLKKVSSEALGHSTVFQGLMLRCGELVHGAGLAVGTSAIHPLTFFYLEDLGLGLACVSGLPGGESRIARFQVSDSGKAALN